MLDPVSAIGLVAAIVQFVEFGAEIIQGAREVHGATSGATERNRSLEVVVRQTRDMISKLNDPDYAQDTEDGKALGRVAHECTILANQMLHLLQKVKAKDPNSTLQAVWAALKNQRYRGEMLELQERLDSCRNHVEFQLNYLTSAETKSRLAVLVASTEGLADQLGILQKHVEELRCGTKVTTLSRKAQEQLQKLVQLSDETLSKIKHQHVLAALAYSGMETRFEEVSEEHRKTFEWIFEDTTGSLGRGASNQESFVHWLSAGRGIFHICGKLGSGKSTLMKFLCNHPRTEAELQHWAGDRKLVFAKFFFWRGATTAEQKSLTGLLRSLLYETLRACPELIPEVLPDLWAQLDVSLPQQQAGTRLDLGKLRTRQAVSSLIHHRNLYRKHCFCFFVDGLDEFEKTAQDGYGDLIRLLQSWTDAAPEAVKICVSSREDLVFMDAFSGEKRFRLQDLTRDDIHRYVQDKLPVIEADGKGAELAQKITERADGIFLWVALVVKSIRDQLDENYELSDVQEELDRLPSELQGLFEYLLKSISRSGRKRAYRTFAMVLKLRHYEINMRLLAYSFLEDYERSPCFAMEASFPFWDMGDFRRTGREELARKKLYRNCRGLLEVKEGETGITVTHRSILEFLESPTVKAEMKDGIDGFSTEDAISQLFLAELQCQKKTLPTFHLSHIVFAVVDMRKRSNMDQDPFRFLETLCSAMIYHDGVPTLPIREFILVETGRGAAVATGLFRESRFAGSFTTSPLHISAFHGGCDYIAWKFQREPTIVENAFEIGIILCCITLPPKFYLESFDKKLELLELILNRGLSPNAVIHTCSPNSNFDGELSFWQHFILTLVPLPDKAKRGCGRLIQMFLERDADPYMWMSKGQPSLVDQRVRYPVIITLGRERCQTIVVEHEKFYKSVLQLLEGGKEISVREMLESWKLDNEETILRLLDRNVRRRELMAANVGIVADNRVPEDQEEGADQDLDLSDPQPAQQQLTPASTLEEAKHLTTKDSGLWVRLTTGIHVPSFVLGKDPCGFLLIPNMDNDDNLLESGRTA
ncbi:hypothetical protein AYL99_05015 [Fonsecaea erecta]|uniref:Uncharacterized protein n=1 Tax=Fonsecaea erecta TaxID=1367422 RepID=A0A178ZLB7_9EURO|nr:hypothetical protein AYL99_05015 [Fonsecaea erecta]OAP60013.1 hypothetical protein AYL99_05015 [Fonsecaea erecta]